MMNVLHPLSFCVSSAKTNNRRAEDRPPSRVLSISVIKLASDCPRFVAILLRLSQNGSSSEMLVRCPWMVTERFFTLEPLPSVVSYSDFSEAGNNFKVIAEQKLVDNLHPVKTITTIGERFGISGKSCRIA